MNLLIDIKDRLNKFGEKLNEERLIIFDYRVISIILICILFFTLFVLLKIHGSSIAYWHNIIGDKQDGIIFGTPRGIRSDEWLVGTPFMMAQCARHFPQVNKNLGEGKTPLLTSLPVFHYSAFFRPHLYGFFIFDKERAFAFCWNFKWFGLIISFFLMFMLLTENKIILSLFGALWIYLSSFSQWWYSTALPDMLTSFAIIFISFIYIFFSKKRIVIIITTFLFIIFSVNFVFFLYPPFQILLVYLLLFLLTGYFINHGLKKEFLLNNKKRIIYIIFTIIIPIIIILFFYIDVKDTINLMMQTDYPGKRNTEGITMELDRIFSGFYDIFYRESSFPAKWGNVCEASNFILFYPLILILNIKQMVLKKRFSILEICLLIYLTGLSIFIVYNFPSEFAKLTLFNMIHPNRVLLGLGIGSIILTIIFLNNSKEEKPGHVLYFVIFITLMILYNIYLNSKDAFFDYRKFLIVSILYSCISYLLFSKKQILFFILILIMVVPNFFINPFSTGLKPLFNKKITNIISYINNTDPQGKWLVLGDHLMANYLKASGINVFNGVKYLPDLPVMQLLDPELKYKHIYNRYAHIECQVSQNITNKTDDISFNLLTPDHYQIFIHPDSEKLKEIGITYILFTYNPYLKNVKNFHPLINIPDSNMWIYEATNSNHKIDVHKIFGGIYKPEVHPDNASSFLYHIDSINDKIINKREVSVITGNNITIKGWAAEKDIKNIAGGIYIEIDGKVYPAVYGLERQDVADIFNNPGYKYSGFHITLNLSKGIHKVSIKILSHDKKIYYIPEEKILFKLQ